MSATGSAQLADSPSGTFIVFACDMVTWCRVLVVLAFTASIADADPEVMIGAEIRSHLSKPDPDFNQLDPSASGGGLVGGLVTTLAYRLSPHFSVGVHGSVASRSYATYESGNMQSFHYDYSTIPVDVGVTLEYTAAGRLWVAPWMGPQFTRRSTTFTSCYRVPSDPGRPWPCTTRAPTDEWTRSVAVGITAGLNLWCRGAHCVAVLIDLEGPDDSAVSFGLAYHL